LSRRRLLDRAPFTALGLVWPGPAPAQASGPVLGDGATWFRLVTANALYPNRRHRAWADAVVRLEADVLCVEELTPDLDGMLDGCLPHSRTHPAAKSAGTGVWSRFPLHAAEVQVAGWAMVVAELSIGVTVAAVHTVAPSRQKHEGPWWRSFEAVAELAGSTTGPLVVAGDFNATFAHGPMQELLASSRLRDAHVDAGRPRARTWNARLPTALLDHVLVSPEVAVRSIAEHRLPGSDHLAVLAELGVAST